MKIVVLFLLLQLFPAAVQGAYYRWDDAGGVTHFTNDPAKIPLSYRKRAKKLGLFDLPPASRAARVPPPEAVTPGPAQPAPPTFGGQPETWWRHRFAALRGEVQTLTDGLPDKQTKLSELRRKRAVYMRGEDREAVNSMLAVISADVARISELHQRIEELENEASRSGVPAEWRQ